MQGATVIIESGTNTHVGRITLMLCLLYACAMNKSKSVKAVLRVLACAFNLHAEVFRLSVVN